MSTSKEQTKDDCESSELTMLDVLEEEQELEEDANAVLGGSDDQNCTYSQGYVKRQALYACSTCITPDMEPAGLCLACSYACHEGHELYELYTKRNFKCDCGNSKFPKNACRLYTFQAKDPSNAKNKYNHNFWGKYCSCERPYPDLDDNTTDEMIQCIICEDWYHGRHLGGVIPENSDYSEMTCMKCMKLYSFLKTYKSILSSTETKAQETQDIDVETPEDKEVSEQKELCILNLGNPSETTSEDTAAFWPEGWRKKLCRCVQCMELYKLHQCSFLLDEQDTIHSYEEQGKKKTGDQSRYDQGLSALQNLDRVRQMEAIHEYNLMKSELKDYLKKFVESKKIVREEDIREFFSKMQSRKRQRTENSVPHFCR